MKNDKIQAVRALAIFAVVLIHTCPLGKWQVIFRPFLNFAVATFLFLSGYLTKLNNVNWKVFYKKRISRVYIPYFIWNILYSILLKNQKSILFNLITTKATGTLYYIYVYIQFVLLTPLIGKLAKSKYKIMGWFISPISLILFKYIWLIKGIEMNETITIIWDVCCLGWFSFYYLGILLGNNLIRVKYNKKILYIYIISIILQIIEGNIWYKLGDINCGSQLKLTSLFTSTIFMLIIFNYLKSEKSPNKLSVFIGNFSFGIYLSHILIKRIIDNLPFYNYIPYIFNSILVLFTSLLFVLFLNKICGKKLSKWLGLI